MIDSNDFEYSIKSSSSVKGFNIHSLSKSGLNSYINDDSHVNSYVGRLNRRILKKLMSDGEKTNDQNSIKDDEATKYPLDQIGFSNGLDTAKIKVRSDEKLEISDKNSNLNKISNHESFAKTFSNFKKTNNDIKDSFYKKLNIHDSQTFKNPDRFFNLKNTVLKDKSKDKLNNTGNNFNKSRGKIGFESYNVPRLDKDKFLQKNYENLKSSNVSRFTDRLAHSIGFKDFDQKINKFERIRNENEKINNIFLNQTSSNFLKNSKLPKIALIVNKPKLTVKKCGIGNSKLMGNKYNPANYQQDNQSNFGRNYYGALYQH